jgi:L-lactate dehydrogenase (cytochrome)
MPPVSFSDFRAVARRRLPHFLFEYIDGGSYAEETLRRNVTDLAAIALRQRVLRDVSAIDLSTTVLGTPLTLPVLLAPVGLAGLYSRRAELAAARAAEDRGVAFCLSTMGICGIEELRQGLTKPFWFQLYVMRDRGFMRDLVARAEAAGCSALVLTVDLPVAGSRYRDVRSGLATPPGPRSSLRRGLQMLARPRWLRDVGLLGRPHTLGNLAGQFGDRATLADYFGWIATQFDASVDWKDLEALRSLWRGPLIVKGILDADDARLAADLGVDAIVVSNHGGRQLDGVPSTAAALPAIADAVADRLTILADSGVRSGLDVVRLMALGARAVLLGRPWAYAVAADGERGVVQLLDLIAAEMRVALALCGCPRARDIDSTLLVPRR